MNAAVQPGMLVSAVQAEAPALASHQQLLRGLRHAQARSASLDRIGVDAKATCVLEGTQLSSLNHVVDGAQRHPQPSGSLRRSDPWRRFGRHCAIPSSRRGDLQGLEVGVNSSLRPAGGPVTECCCNLPPSQSSTPSPHTHVTDQPRHPGSQIGNQLKATTGCSDWVTVRPFGKAVNHSHDQGIDRLRLSRRIGHLVSVVPTVAKVAQKQDFAYCAAQHRVVPLALRLDPRRTLNGEPE